LQQYSKLWSSVDLSKVEGKPLAVATDMVLADALAAATDNNYAGDGSLREVRRVDHDTGHVVKEYIGKHPMAWMRQFTSGRQLARFNLDPATRIKR
jgi:hypothetical protein